VKGSKEYRTFKVPKATMKKIEEFKRRNGYPSYSQAVTALVERYATTEELLAHLRGTLREVIKQALLDEFVER